MATGGKQRTHFTILSESPMRLSSAIHCRMKRVIAAWNRIAVPPNCSSPTPSSDNKVHRAVTAGHSSFSHRVVARGVGLKTQPRFAQDPKLPQLRQQAANSA
jgi:hypothetical protein